MHTLQKFIASGIVFLVALVMVLLGMSGVARADNKPARSEVLAVGPYVTEVNLSQDPPQVEQPLEVTVVPHDAIHLSGRITALPGLGTDAAPLHAALTPDAKGSTRLVGGIRLPVRGSWHLVVDLDGPRGHGTANLDVTVAAPNAIPLWLGWLIGLSPLVGCAWLVWQQGRYRRSLLMRERVSIP